MKVYLSDMNYEIVNTIRTESHTFNDILTISPSIHVHIHFSVHFNTVMTQPTPTHELY